MPSIIKQLLAKCYPPTRRGFKPYTETIKEISGILVPMQIAVLNLETGRRTLMSYGAIALNVAVDDDFLTQRVLTDGVFRESHLKKYQAAY